MRCPFNRYINKASLKSSKMLISGNVSELSLDDDFLTPHDISSPRRRSSVGSNDRIIIIREGRWAGIAVYTNHEDSPRLTPAILSTIHLAPFSNLLIITNSLANRTICVFPTEASPTNSVILHTGIPPPRHLSRIGQPSVSKEPVL